MTRDRLFLVVLGVSIGAVFPTIAVAPIAGGHPTPAPCAIAPKEIA